ncbi:CYTH domain-containing protein [Methylophaga sp.]|jgi:inorganic triphosphatase YgiF|uniref:CYTH domain-containing protein n=1 Tax=Methylophaga sp. TaxID=2024840 RepID=UPI0013FF5CF3|nr:CYTH domain-containing protein [Methylophaga sp.]MTI63627.1 CYTH domain-containing protein [Methylophaga sp.]
MSLEQEIKLQVSQDEALSLECLDWLMALLEAPSERIHLLSTYYDTPNRDLQKFGAGLRLRQIGEQWLQTVKCTGKTERGLHQRKEWEHQLAGPEFDKALLNQTELAPLIEDAAIWNALSPLFTTEFERLVLPLRLTDGTRVEMAYDRGEVRAGDRQAIIHEIELELKAGEIKKVQQLADRLKAALPLQYSDISKAAQGYGLVQVYEK